MAKEQRIENIPLGSPQEDTVSFYDEYSDDINDYIRDAIGSEFLTETFDNNEGNLTGYKNDIVWTFIELYAMELIDNINNEEMEITGSYVTV